MSLLGLSVTVSVCRYRILKEVGDGTCGTVYKALNMETYEIVRFCQSVN